MHLSKILGVTVGMSALLALGTANADVYSFSFAGSGLSGSGDFITSGTTSPYAVIDVTGTASDASYFTSAPSAITGLSGFLFADNLLYYPGQPYVDGFGISFDTADGNAYWLGGNSIASFGTLFVADYPGALPVQLSVTLSSVTPVPEPSTWAMMIVGFAGLYLAGYLRARQKITIPITAA
jgi:hypothetical protein